MRQHVVVLLSTEEGRALVRQVCEEAKVPPEALQDLIDAELEQVGKQRKAGLWERFDEIFDAFEIET